MSNTTYLVSARKYRPLLFKDVVAQEHVTETLKNAIRLERLAHAYMFTGPRGVGKTTAARIVAKAINCTTPSDEREDPSEPCRKCVSCMSFEEGRNMNIIEIDAASNNKVEDIRDLRDTIRIPPQNNRMKVYIIDEVHMLTNAAFNALLKTLEEPPPHAMFIFATTEPHKVLPTIQSRCQRFDFRRIATQESVERLRLICQIEDIQADEESLMLIARKGDGALRDALSVFDQAVSLCGTNITYSNLIAALGVVDTDVYFDITRAVVEGQSAEMIRIVDRIVRAGYDLQEFVDGLAEHVRNLLVAVSVDDPGLIEATETDRRRLKKHGAEFSESTLLTLIHIIGDVSETLRLSRQPRLKLEMALLRMSSIPKSVDVRSALDKLTNLEKMAVTGKVRIEVDPTPVPSAPRPTPAAPVSAPRVAAPATSTPSPGPSAAPTPAAPAAIPPPALSPPPKTEATVSKPEAPRAVEGTASTAPQMAKRDPQELPEADQAEPLGMFEPPEIGHPTSRESVHSAESTTPPASPPDDGMSLFFAPPALNRSKPKPDTNAQLVDEDEVMVLDEVETSFATDESEEIQALKTAWSTLVQGIMESEKQLGSFLRHATIFAFDSKTLFLAVPDDFHAKALRSERVKLMHQLSDLAGFRIDRIAFRVETPSGEKDLIPESESSVRESLELLCEKYPAVRTLVERFGGEIVW
ncbi:DNA polymerase III subunit gamma/tau [bacterium]|nr:DNA polymerase III subunit gamma/tau [bacterium]